MIKFNQYWIINSSYRLKRPLIDKDSTQSELLQNEINKLNFDEAKLKIYFFFHWIISILIRDTPIAYLQLKQCSLSRKKCNNFTNHIFSFVWRLQQNVYIISFWAVNKTEKNNNRNWMIVLCLHFRNAWERHVHMRLSK